MSLLIHHSPTGNRVEPVTPFPSSMPALLHLPLACLLTCLGALVAIIWMAVYIARHPSS